MSDVIIQARGLGKKYILSHDVQERYTALRDVIQRNTANLFKKKERKSKEEFWALRDIGFEIKKGEAIGIIGRNGAGKSTLLKILSRITEPSTGRVEMNGRTSSLLEVGTGFHPELTGRENIFLNGAVLGMGRHEIKKKFDTIVEFAGVSKFLDTPVKRYSSGMYLRLAFAIAAHLEPEILIVDEVLAVGDAEFQKKCLGKMDEVSKTEGRTVLFVSHNMKAVQQLCTKLFYLEQGRLEFEGDIDEGLSRYQRTIGVAENDKSVILSKRNVAGKKAYVSGIEVRQPAGSKNMQLGIFIEATEAIEKAEIAAGINDLFGNRIITFHSRFLGQEFNLAPGKNEFVCTAGNFFLKPGLYNMNIFLGNKYETLDYPDEPVSFEIHEFTFYPAGTVPDNSQGYLMAEHTWLLKNADDAGH